MQLGKIPFIGRRARRTWLVLGTVVALTLAIALPGLATLSPSTFNAGDGNLTVQGSETDWATPAHAPTPSSQGRSRSRKTSIKGPSPLAGAEFDIRKAS